MKNVFVTLSTASVLSSVLAIIATATHHPQISNIFLCVAAAVTSFLCWEFACKTKSCAEKRLDLVEQERDNEALWRELDKVHERIASVENRGTNKR